MVAAQQWPGAIVSFLPPFKLPASQKWEKLAEANRLSMHIHTQRERMCVCVSGAAFIHVPHVLWAFVLFQQPVHLHTYALDIAYSLIHAHCPCFRRRPRIKNM